VAELPHDFFRNQAHVAPLSDAANRDARSGNARPSAANLGQPKKAASI